MFVVMVSSPKDKSMIGKMSDFRVYNRVLSHYEINLIYYYERVNFWKWYKRLWFWTKETWRLLSLTIVLIGCMKQRPTYHRRVGKWTGKFPSGNTR